MDGDLEMTPVVESGTLDGTVVKAESQRTHQMEGNAESHAESSDCAGVMRYFRSYENNRKIHLAQLQYGCRRDRHIQSKKESDVFLYSFVEISITDAVGPGATSAKRLFSASKPALASSTDEQCIMAKRLYGNSGHSGRS